MQSNKTCRPVGRSDSNSANSNDSNANAHSNSGGAAFNSFNCTCRGRRGDPERGCYDAGLDPATGDPDPAALALLLGGEAALWGEGVDGRNLEAAVFMGACAVAERLWAARGVLDAAGGWARLLQLQRRMRERGFGDTALPPFTTALSSH